MTPHKNSYCPIRQHRNGKQYEQAIDSGKGYCQSGIGFDEITNEIGGSTPRTY